MSGWIKLHRKIADNPLWHSEKFTRAQAWIDLILIANHADGYMRTAGKRINIKRGQVGHSELSLAGRWGWSRGKTKRFIGELICDHQIEQRIVQRSSVITICNYEEYQGERRLGSTTDRTADSTTDGQQTGQQTDNKQDTNKKVKNEENEENVKNKARPSSADEVEQYGKEINFAVNGQAFIDYYDTAGWMRGKNKIKDWKACLRTWKRKRDEDAGNNGHQQTKEWWETKTGIIDKAKSRGIEVSGDFLLLKNKIYEIEGING